MYPDDLSFSELTLKKCILISPICPIINVYSFVYWVKKKKKTKQINDSAIYITAQIT